MVDISLASRILLDMKSATKKNTKAIEMLAAMLAMCDANIIGMCGEERARKQGEIDGIRAQMKKLGA
jgi:hypothetical protein